MRLPTSTMSALSVALVAIALLQLDAYRARRAFDRSVVASHPLAADVTVEIPEASPYRLLLRGNERADQVPERIEYTALRPHDREDDIARYAGVDARRAVRQSPAHRVTLATIEHVAAGRYIVHLDAAPPLPSLRRPGDETVLLLLRGTRDAAPSPRLALALTSVLVIALVVAGIGTARAVRDGA